MNKYLFIIVLLMTGCSSGESYNKKTYGAEWPFTVDQVTVGCDAMGFPYVDAGREGTYGLTGHSVNNGYPAATPIQIMGKDLGPFIETALSLCKK